MIANRHRGEIVAEFDGTKRRLCLTLGVLAELETSYGSEDLADLLARFSGGRFSARDLSRILAAGLRGGGLDVDEAEVGRMTMEGGAVGMASTVAELLAVTFGGAVAAGGGGQEPNPPTPRKDEPRSPGGN